MNTPSRNRNLLFIIAVLVLTNIAVLGYFLWFKKPGDKRGGGLPDRNGWVINRLKDSVGFTDDQIKQYEILKDEQWTTIKPMFDEMRKAKENLFRLLSDPNANDSVVRKATDAIAEEQRNLDLQTFNHFKKVRAICTPDQQPKYDSMIQRMFRKMGKVQRKGDQDKNEKK